MAKLLKNKRFWYDLSLFLQVKVYDDTLCLSIVTDSC